MQPHQKTCGVTRWQYSLWFGVPALLLLCGLDYLVTHLKPWQLLGPGLFVVLYAPLVFGLAVCVGLAGVYCCYGLADDLGPWVVVENPLLPIFYQAGRGYAGPLCLPAGVEPGRVYGTWLAANAASGRLTWAAGCTEPYPVICQSLLHRLLLPHNAPCIHPANAPRFAVTPYYQD